MDNTKKLKTLISGGAAVLGATSAQAAIVAAQGIPEGGLILNKDIAGSNTTTLWDVDGGGDDFSFTYTINIDSNSNPIARFTIAGLTDGNDFIAAGTSSSQTSILTSMGNEGSVQSDPDFASWIGDVYFKGTAGTYDYGGGPYFTGGAFSSADGEVTLFTGFRFIIEGETHYGWAELEVTGTGRGIDTDGNPILDPNTNEPIGPNEISTKILRAYYEDTPNETILAGVVVPEPSSVALLALGAAGLAGFRRRAS